MEVDDESHHPCWQVLPKPQITGLGSLSQLSITPHSGVPQISIKTLTSCEFAVKCLLLNFKGLINELKQCNYFFGFYCVKLVFNLFPGPVFLLAPRLSITYQGSPFGDLCSSYLVWLCKIFLVFCWLGFWGGFGGLFFFNFPLFNIT